MSESSDTPETSGTDRWTKDHAEAGDDPRDIEADAQDPEHAQKLTDTRHVTHADESVPAEHAMGTSSDSTHPAPEPSDS